jgi:copper resistance protein C
MVSIDFTFGSHPINRSFAM